MSVRTSLVVPTRGGARRLPVLLDALARQTDPDFEVVVVVDGDTDRSEDVLRARTDLSVRTIVFPQNRGRSAALNAGFEAATGELLVRCDDDLEPAPSYVAGWVGALADQERGVIGIYRNQVPDTPYARVYGRPAEQRLRASAYAAGPEATWRFWAGNVGVRRASWERVGTYDTDFRAYGWEDVEWGYRLHTAGVPIVVDPALETTHHAAAVTTAGRAHRALYSGAARARFEGKHGTAAFPSQGQRGAWKRAVDTLARTLDERRVQRLGRIVDASLDRTPAAVGGKAVALLVEAAFESGYRRPSVVGRAL